MKLTAQINDRALIAKLDRLPSKMTPAQEAAAIFRRKAIYEELHPETKVEANASSARKTSDNLSFVSATAETVGKDKRTVERAVHRGEALGNDLRPAGRARTDRSRLGCKALRRCSAPGDRKPHLDRKLDGAQHVADVIGVAALWRLPLRRRRTFGQRQSVAKSGGSRHGWGERGAGLDGSRQRGDQGARAGPFAMARITA